MFVVGRLHREGRAEELRDISRGAARVNDSQRRATAERHIAPTRSKTTSGFRLRPRSDYHLL